MTSSKSVDIAAKLKALPVLQGCDDNLLAELASGLKFLRIETGDVLFRAQEPAHSCYIVSMGSVKLSRTTAGGREAVMCFCRPGDFIAAAIMMNPKPFFPLTATSMESSALLQIPRQIYVDVWQSKPEIARSINLNIMGRMMEFQDDKTMSTSPVPEKIARFLLRSLESQPTLYGNTLNLKLSRKDIADRVGTTVETVIRVLSQWTQKGWIATEEHRIVILDRAALEALLNHD